MMVTNTSNSIFSSAAYVTCSPETPDLTSNGVLPLDPAGAIRNRKKNTANYLVALKLVIEPYVLGGKHRSRASPWPEPGWSLSTTMAPVSWVLSTSGRGVSELKQ